jgi:hypothetical protein
MKHCRDRSKDLSKDMNWGFTQIKERSKIA